MLERMDDFFTARINGYDEHMKSNIEGASLFISLQQLFCRPVKTQRCLIWVADHLDTCQSRLS